MNNNESYESILKILPEKLKEQINFIFNNNIQIDEIRLSIGKPATIDMGDICMYLKKDFKENDLFTKDIFKALIIDKKIIESVLSLASDNSLYAFENELKNGFITLKGGHRIGVCGTAVYENGAIKTIKNISSVIIRIARCFGLNDEYFARCIFDGKEIKNTVISGRPKSGKTTLLRSVAKYLSDCTFNETLGKIIKVGIIDERMEIASVSNGENMLDTGVNSFVMNGVNKTDGCEFMIRSFSPDVIIMDEIWSNGDYAAVKRAIGAGCNVICTSHSSYLHSKNILSILPIDLCVYIEKCNNIVNKKYIYKNERGVICDNR